MAQPDKPCKTINSITRKRRPQAGAISASTISSTVPLAKPRKEISTLAFTPFTAECHTPAEIPNRSKFRKETTLGKNSTKAEANCSSESLFWGNPFKFQSIKIDRDESSWETCSNWSTEAVAGFPLHKRNEKHVSEGLIRLNADQPLFSIATQRRSPNAINAQLMQSTVSNSEASKGNRVATPVNSKDARRVAETATFDNTASAKTLQETFIQFEKCTFLRGRNASAATGLTSERDHQNDAANINRSVSFYASSVKPQEKRSTSARNLFLDQKTKPLWSVDEPISQRGNAEDTMWETSSNWSTEALCGCPKCSYYACTAI